MITDTIVIPIDSNELLLKVQNEAREDKGHHIFNPTHAIMRNGEIIGAFSVWSPTCHCWMHTDRMSSKSFKMAYQGMDTLMRQQKTPEYLINMHRSSPFYDILDKRMDQYTNDAEEDWVLFWNKV
jgi:hypothetical protein